MYHDTKDPLNPMTFERVEREEMVDNSWIKKFGKKK